MRNFAEVNAPAADVDEQDQEAVAMSPRLGAAAVAAMTAAVASATARSGPEVVTETTKEADATASNASAFARCEYILPLCL